MSATLWKIIAGLVLLAALMFSCFMAGDHHVQKKWDAEKAAEQKQADFHQVQSDAWSDTTHNVYLHTVTEIKTKGDTIIREVPKYVTVKDDSVYAVNRGFIRVLNAAATGVPISEAPSGTDGSPAGIAISAIATHVAGNYEQCRLTAAQLTSMQSWVEGQGRIAATPAPQ